MKNLKIALLKSVMDTARNSADLRVDTLFLPEQHKDSDPEKFAKFGVLLLEDGHSGFIYTLLDEDMVHSSPFEKLISQAAGQPVSEIAGWYLSDDASRRYIGMAAINALSQSLFAKSGFFSDANAVKRKKTQPEHLGMVGFFPPLVEKYRKSGQKLTVLEQQARFVMQEENITVTLDVEALSQCDQVLCTASTLLNDSLANIIGACASNSRISLIGPTAGCLPDALFSAGISEVGATRVLNIETLLSRIRSGTPWGDSVMKYTITKEDYSGLRALK